MRLHSLLLASVALAVAATPALAQSGCSTIVPGAVLTAAQWNACFVAKQDSLGYTPITAANLAAVAPITSSTGGGVTQFGLSIGANLTLVGGALTVTGIPTLASANTWTGIQTINLNGATPPAADTGTVLALLGADGGVSRTEITAAGGAAAFTGRRADGTVGSPTALQVNDLIAAFNIHGYDGTSWSTLVAGAYRTYADGVWSNTSHPTRNCLGMTPAASTTIADVFCASGTGAFTFGIVSSVTGQIQLANAASAFLTTIQAGNAAAARTYVWPTNFGVAGSFLQDAAGNGTLSWNAAPSLVNFQVFTSSGTYTAAAGITYTQVVICGSGGGGAGGARSNGASAIATGGGGGGGGVCRYAIYKASDLGSSQVVTIGAVGTHGVGATVNNTAGTSGTPGGSSCFGGSAGCGGTPILIAYGGGGGDSQASASGLGGGGGAPTAAGTTAVTTVAGISEVESAAIVSSGGSSPAHCSSNTGGTNPANNTPPAYPCVGGGGGGGVSASAGANASGPGASSFESAPGGGAGGGNVVANTGTAGGAGGRSIGCFVAPGGGAAGANNGGSTAADFNYHPGCGGGGGGGANASGASGGIGGNGTNGGGGGGGGSGDNANGANGGDGGTGFAAIASW